MHKYVDIWYALKTTKHAQTILEGVCMETTKARAVLRKKIIIVPQDSSVDWRFSYTSGRNTFKFSLETTLSIQESSKVNLVQSLSNQ